MTFGENVRRIREMRGISQEELAHRVGFGTRGAICKVEKDVVDPPQSMVKKLAKALDVSLLEFFDDYKTDYSKSPMQEFVPYLEKASAEKLSIIRKILDMDWTIRSIQASNLALNEIKPKKSFME